MISQNPPLSQEERVERIVKSFRFTKDFPKAGVNFLDIMPIFADPELLSTTVDAFEHLIGQTQFDSIVGL